RSFPRPPHREPRCWTLINDHTERRADLSEDPSALPSETPSTPTAPSCRPESASVCGGAPDHCPDTRRKQCFLWLAGHRVGRRFPRSTSLWSTSWLLSIQWMWRVGKSGRHLISRPISGSCP